MDKQIRLSITGPRSYEKQPSALWRKPHNRRALGEYSNMWDAVSHRWTSQFGALRLSEVLSKICEYQYAGQE